VAGTRRRVGRGIPEDSAASSGNCGYLETRSYGTKGRTAFAVHGTPCPGKRPSGIARATRPDAAVCLLNSRWVSDASPLGLAWFESPVEAGAYVYCRHPYTVLGVLYPNLNSSEAALVEA